MALVCRHGDSLRACTLTHPDTPTRHPLQCVCGAFWCVDPEHQDPRDAYQDRLSRANHPSRLSGPTPSELGSARAVVVGLVLAAAGWALVALVVWGVTL